MTKDEGKVVELVLHHAAGRNAYVRCLGHLEKFYDTYRTLCKDAGIKPRPAVPVSLAAQDFANFMEGVAKELE